MTQEGVDARQKHLLRENLLRDYDTEGFERVLRKRLKIISGLTLSDHYWSTRRRRRTRNRDRVNHTGLGVHDNVGTLVPAGSTRTATPGGARGGAGILVRRVATMMADLGDLPGGERFRLEGVMEMATPLFPEEAARTIPADRLRRKGASGSTVLDVGCQGFVVVASGRAGFDEGGRGGDSLRVSHGAGCTDATFLHFFCIFLTF